MTIFVADASHYQAGLSMQSLADQGIVGVILKATEGTSFVDSSFAGQLQAARDAGLLTAAYHFLHAGNQAAQARHTASVVPADVPIWADVEGGSTREDAYPYCDELRRRGRIVGGIYFGAVPKDGYGGWWRAGYLSDPSGFASVAYAKQGGDASVGWGPFHGHTPDLWQYCQHGRITGFSGDVDFSAFRGTLAELAASGWFWVPPNLGDDMPLTNADADLVVDRLLARKISTGWNEDGSFDPNPAHADTPTYGAMIAGTRGNVLAMANGKAAPQVASKAQHDALGAALVAANGKLDALATAVAGIPALVLAGIPVNGTGLTAADVQAACDAAVRAALGSLG